MISAIAKATTWLVIAVAVAAISACVVGALVGCAAWAFRRIAGL